ncbi:MAG: hypothetical protein JOY77_01575 [Alphaproteobacteria bacterium]|nr:hypothetical protein [Alphaproteobacteria bacterium]MBV9061601.1 hypothetical protein [Alphaproteobacteria bacterium]
MASDVWLPLDEDERSLIRLALSSYAREGNRDKVMALSRKVATAAPYPDITVGVHGGLVQWTLGNPFPIRICDYDGDDQDLTDMDERGQRCTMWFEPADDDCDAHYRKRA